MNPPDTGAASVPDVAALKRGVELLAGYLVATGRTGCPGTDGLTVAEAVAAFYRVAAEAGRVPDRTELARRHPDQTDAITALLGAD